MTLHINLGQRKLKVIFSVARMEELKTPEWVKVVLGEKEAFENRTAPVKRREAGGLYHLFLMRLEAVPKLGELIPWIAIYSHICPRFSITKEECREVVFLLAEWGELEIVKFKGVRVL